MKGRISVSQVEPGFFSTERYVTFEVAGKPYSLFVDAGSVKDQTLEVQVVERDGQTVLVELPRDTVNAGSRVRVPNAALLPG